MASPSIKYDLARLTALDRIRATKRATVTGLNDAYHDRRAALTDIERRRAQTAQAAEYSGPRSRVEHVEQGAKLAQQAETARAELRQLQSELDAEAAAAAEAGRLFASCLRYAVDHGLEIPPALAPAAEISRGNFHPRRSA